jgi:hypothetical protein
MWPNRVKTTLTHTPYTTVTSGWCCQQGEVVVTDHREMAFQPLPYRVPPVCNAPPVMMDGNCAEWVGHVLVGGWLPPVLLRAGHAWVVARCTFLKNGGVGVLTWEGRYLC